MTFFIRSQLTKDAEKSSIEVFATNLKSLLLTPPLKGHTILALDPGFKNGCKSAVISPTGWYTVYFFERNIRLVLVKCYLILPVIK